MTTDLVLVKRENVEMIVQNAPQSYNENQISHDKCLEFGQNIMNSIQAAGGMTDELDRQAADFIERARKTAKKMNEKRAPVTKLFDEIRTVFTTMESDVDPLKPTSLPGKLQKLRNDYATAKRAEAEARRREEERLKRIEAARNSYHIAVEEDYKQSFRRMLNTKFNELTALNNNITLENFTEQEKAIKDFSTILAEDWLKAVPSGAMLPQELDSSETTAIRNEVINELAPKFREQYAFDIGENQYSILSMLPSKKKELEAIAKAASSDEALRRQEEMKQREAAQARKLEEDRIRKEEEEKQQLQVKQQQNDMIGLFNTEAASTPTYQPKLQVKKKIVINSSLAFLDILNLWWTTEGCTLSVDELTKKFKPQISHCEKLANDKVDPHFIQSKYLSYEEDVKAK